MIPASFNCEYTSPNQIIVSEVYLMTSLLRADTIALSSMTNQALWTDDNGVIDESNVYVTMAVKYMF